MKVFICIIVSLLMGYRFGIRRKKMKIARESLVLKKENEELNKKIIKLQKIERLKQYSAKPTIKFNQDYFEQELTRYTTRGAIENQTCYILMAFLKQISFESDNIVTFAGMHEAIERYIEIINLSTNDKVIKVQQMTNGYVDINIFEAAKSVYKFLLEAICINDYEITYEMMMESLNLVQKNSKDIAYYNVSLRR